MFVLSRLNKGSRAPRQTQEEWREERNNIAYQHGWQYAHAWERDHPEPKEPLQKRVDWAFLIFLTVVGVLFGMGVASALENTSSTRLSIDGHDCHAFNMDNKVMITSGRDDGKTGTIVGGCGPEDQTYLVKLDENGINVELRGYSDLVVIQNSK